jgi:hypothetical protein
VASVAAGWAAAGYELLTPEGHTAIPAVPGFNADFRLIDEHFISSLQALAINLVNTAKTLAVVSCKPRLSLREVLEGKHSIS